jgi:hypothetical protein
MTWHGRGLGGAVRRRRCRHDRPVPCRRVSLPKIERAEDGFIHHLATLVDANTNPLVKGTVIALDQMPRGASSCSGVGVNTWLMTGTWAGWTAHRLPKPTRLRAAVECRRASRSRKSVATGPIGGASPAAAEASSTWTRMGSSSRSSADGWMPTSAHRSSSPSPQLPHSWLFGDGSGRQDTGRRLQQRHDPNGPFSEAGPLLGRPQQLTKTADLLRGVGLGSADARHR